jgi:hypothetical protein
MKSWKEKVLDDESVHRDVGDVYMEWKNRFEFIAKKVVGMKSRCVRKGVKKLPKFVKRLYEIRNTLRKEAEAEGDKKLFQLADDVSQKIKKICIEGNKKRWDSFCAEVCMEKLGARDFFSALHRVMGSKSTEVCGIRYKIDFPEFNFSELRFFPISLFLVVRPIQFTKNLACWKLIMK